MSDNPILRLASRLPLLKRLALGEKPVVPEGVTASHGETGCKLKVDDVFLVKRADGVVACFCYHKRGKLKPIACQITI